MAVLGCRSLVLVIIIIIKCFPVKCCLVDQQHKSTSILKQKPFSTNDDITLRDHQSVTGMVTTHWSVTVLSQKLFCCILMSACYLLSCNVID